MKILAIDWGKRKIGVAISDNGCKIAFPRPYVKSSKKAVEEIMTVLDKERIKLVLIGWPVKENGQNSETTDAAVKFYEKVKKRAKNVEVELFDERYTSRIVDSVMDNFGLKWQQKVEIKDSLAAVVMLQGYLDAQPKS